MTPDILRDFPDQIETERLTIRAPRPGDGTAVNAAIVESWPRLQVWMDWAQSPHPHTVAETETFVRRSHAAFVERRDLQLLCFLRGTDVYVAGSGLHRVNWTIPRFEIGYWVRTQFEGQGYVTEAVNAITDFAFGVLGARRVEIRCDARNKASAAVAYRAGYELEATLRCHERAVDGSLRDTLLFARVLPEE
ncbi:MAG: GNAT family N-acetyltransferase [Anaerolineales bacterium]|nr:GNAT family N-acetyltransferase [Anaerolineales bacterium]MCB8951724.1 GNAT family N-acetyltransferase [Ardenticatenales bacterium]